MAPQPGLAGHGRRRRRTFLQVLAAGAGATAVGGVVGGSLARMRQPASAKPGAAEASRPGIRGAGHSAGAEAGLDGMQPLVTPNRTSTGSTQH